MLEDLIVRWEREGFPAPRPREPGLVATVLDEVMVRLLYLREAEAFDAETGECAA